MGNLNLFLIILLVIALFSFNPRVVYSQENNTISRNSESVKAQKISLTLEQAINLALQANRSILTSGYNVQDRLLSLESANALFDLKIYPGARAGMTGGVTAEKELGFGMSFEKRFSAGTKAAIRPDIKRTGDTIAFYNTESAISIEQPLLRGLGKEVNLDGVRGAEFSIRLAERNRYQTKVSIVFETVSTIYDVIRQRELMILYEALSGQLKGHAEFARVKEKAGMATPIDVYRAEISLKDVEESLTAARKTYQDVKDRLKTILALPLETDMEISAPLTVEPITMESSSAIEIALKNRIEMEQLEDELKEAERKTRIAEHNILPELNLVFDYSRFSTSEDFSRSFGLDKDKWGIMLVSRTDLDRTSERSAYGQSLNNIQSLRLSFESKRDEIIRDVRNKLTTLKKLEETIKIRTEQIQQAEGKLSLSKVKFTYGLANNFDVIEAETELQRSRVNLLSANLDYIVETYNIRGVLGTLIERN